MYTSLGLAGGHVLGNTNTPKKLGAGKNLELEKTRSWKMVGARKKLGAGKWEFFGHYIRNRLSKREFTLRHDMRTTFMDVVQERHVEERRVEERRVEERRVEERRVEESRVEERRVEERRMEERVVYEHRVVEISYLQRLIGGSQGVPTKPSPFLRVQEK
jgi:hypothetical protein